MKVFLVNHHNSNDINAFSGVTYFMSRAIKAQFEEVGQYDSIESFDLYKMARAKGVEKVLKPIGENLTSYLSENNIIADYIIFLGGNSSIPFYNYNIPTVFWHDSTWHTFLHGYLDEKKFNEFKQQYKNLYLWDKFVLEKTDILIYSSDYVAEACMKNYRIRSNKVKVIPFGANIYHSPSINWLLGAIRKRIEGESINLAFIGKDWERKGLLLGIKLVEALNSIGVKTKLNIIGCEPDIDEINNSPYLVKWGLINKAERNQFVLFEKILEETHYLIHPAISEPFGIALCEANAYGIPVLGTDVEGLKTIVINGKNGYLFQTNNFVQESINIIKQVKENLNVKVPLISYLAFAEYQKRLNWVSSVSALKKVLSE